MNKPEGLPTISDVVLDKVTDVLPNSALNCVGLSCISNCSLKNVASITLNALNAWDGLNWVEEGIFSLNWIHDLCIICFKIDHAKYRRKQESSGYICPDSVLYLFVTTPHLSPCCISRWTRLLCDLLTQLDLLTLVLILLPHIWGILGADQWEDHEAPWVNLFFLVPIFCILFVK